MEYKLYTYVDITHTGQYRAEPGKEVARWKEQNFNTVLQTLGIRSNVSFNNNPIVTEVKGSLVGFDTDQIVRLWRFDFYTEREHVFEEDGDVQVMNMIPEHHLDTLHNQKSKYTKK